MKTTSILKIHWIGVGRFGQRTREMTAWPSTKSGERNVHTAARSDDSGALSIIESTHETRPGKPGFIKMSAKERTIRTYAPGTWLYFEEVEPNQGDWLELLKDLGTPGKRETVNNGMPGGV